MTYAIKSTEFHNAALGIKSAQHAERLESGVDRLDDRELSAWADTSNADYHRKAIEVIGNGMKAEHPQLKQGDRIVDAKLISTKFGLSWVLADSEAELIDLRGKVFLPFGETSRVLKKLGLKQVRAMVPVKPFFNAACSCIGAAVTFHTIPA